MTEEIRAMEKSICDHFDTRLAELFGERERERSMHPLKHLEAGVNGVQRQRQGTRKEARRQKEK